MSDPLDLIAEARRRQKIAESERDHWKARAMFERRRCRGVIDMIKQRPMPDIDVDAEGETNWDQIVKVVEAFASVIADPYSRFDDEEGNGMTHEGAKRVMAYRLQRIIKAAVAKTRPTP